MLKNFLLLSVLFTFLFGVGLIAQEKNLPKEFADEKIDFANHTIGQFVSLIPGEKTFEVDGQRLIIRSQINDKLTRNKTEVAYLVEKLSNLDFGKIMLSTTPGMPDIFYVSRVVIGGEEQPQGYVTNLNSNITIQLSLAFPEGSTTPANNKEPEPLPEDDNELKPTLVNEEKTYVNGRYGFSVRVPGGLIWRGESDNGDGQMFVSPADGYEMAVFGSFLDSERNPAALMAKHIADLNAVIEKASDASGFGFVGKKGANVVVVKALIKDGTIINCEISFPSSTGKTFKDLPAVSIRSFSFIK